MRTRIFTLLVAFLAIAGNAVWGQTPVSISSAEEMKVFAKKVNENTDNSVRWAVTLEADIDLGGESNPWTPIEDFRGTFDGGNHTISGLYITGIEDFVGLFGEVQNGDIKNLTIRGEIENCIGRIGGICGQHQGTIINCHNEVNITVDEFSMSADKSSGGITVGGISGYGGSFENCSNSGNITINVQQSSSVFSINVGGIGAQSSSTTNCYNSGTITLNGNNYGVGSISIGGVIGSGVCIENSYNTGNIMVKELSLEYPNNMMPAFFISGVVAESHGGWGIEANIHYCYNTGNISIPDNFSSSEDVTVGVGGILGGSIGGINAISNSYYFTQDNISAIGMNTITGETIEAKDNSAFESGEVAWLLHKDGGNFGQGLDANGQYVDKGNKNPVLLAFEENEGTEVYQLKLKVNDSDKGTIYRNSKESNLLSEDEYNDLLVNAVDQDLVWKDGNGNVVVSGNRYIPTEDIALNATVDYVYDISTEVTPEDAGTISVKESAAEGETVSFTVTPNEGYELSSTYYIEEGKEEQVSITNTFSMPASNITIYAIFTEIETEEPEQPGGDEDDDEDQGNTGIHKPQRPIKYYNIYVDTICPGLNVEVSKDVVQEGHQVSAYLTIQAECDTTGMRFEYKRGLFGYWKDLKELEGVQPGEYIIKNIYTDIYIRALDATLPEEEPTGIDDLEGVKAYAKDGSIYVYTPNREEVMIIGMTGAIIKNEEQVGLQSYSVSRGIYIVRIGEKVFKLKN